MALINMPVADAEEPRPAFFMVGIPKLVFMATATLGLYQVYWFFEHWSGIKFRDQTRRDTLGSFRDVRPFLRAVFSIFFAYPLFQEFNGIAQRFGAKRSLAAGPAALAFALLVVAGRLPSPWWLLSFLSVVPLAFAQRVATAAMAAGGEATDGNGGLRGWNWAAVFIGVPLLLLVLVGAAAEWLETLQAS